MPIPLPNLDDHTFAELTEEARAVAPVLYPGWTDHNPSDPGIVLVELLAWLTEMLLFSVNQIPEANTRKFLALLGGPEWSPPAAGGLDAAIRQTMRDLYERYRAVTPEDYEYLVREIWPHSPEATALGELARVQRVRCVPGRNLTAADPSAPAPAHVSVVVVPEVDTPETDPAQDPHPQPAEALTTALTDFLAPRRILTTRHHVVGPSYVDVGIAANVALHEDAPPADTLADVRAQLTAFFHPLTGGGAGDGWPFGQSVYASEVYAAVEQVELVDYVEALRLSGPNPITDISGQVVGIELDMHQLVRLARLDLVGYDSYGRTHPLTWASAS
ncbi:MAG TPA: hypothetical protein VHH34_22770 [Pseudonocardiaceae bacterium]|nr:hypothetical protein [Pseudonocardiaceae bacterium]